MKRKVNISMIFSKINNQKIKVESFKILWFPIYKNHISYLMDKKG